MRVISFFICVFLIPVVSFGQRDSSLQKKIDSLLAVDQQVQTDMIAAYQHNAGQQEKDSLEKVKEQTFDRHIPVLKDIIRQKGLPTYQLVGKENSDNFLTLVNHSFSDIPFQQKVTKLAKAEVKRKNISAPYLALMIDKMKIKSGKKQPYGTQCDYTKEGEAIAINLFKPGTIDNRRAKMGLSPLKTYLKMMTEIHRQMNEKK